MLQISFCDYVERKGEGKAIGEIRLCGRLYRATFTCGPLYSHKIVALGVVGSYTGPGLVVIPLEASLLGVRGVIS